MRKDVPSLTHVGGHSAARSGVQSCSIRADVVHTLQDVNFTVIGPAVLTNFPNGRPGTAALRHVANVEHRDVRGISLLAPKTDAVTASS